MFVTTANTLPNIPAPLQDRMEIISLPGYTEPEKIAIAKKYLIKKQCEANGLTKENIKFTESALKMIVRRYTREAGVRNLEREIASVCRKVARKIVKDKDRKGHVTVTPKKIQQYLGVARFRYGLAEEEDQIGICTGLAWTQVGGELLTAEVSVVPGKGKLTITGKLGEVMQESVQAAVSYVRSRADVLGLDKDFYQTVDIHVHLPEGAIPKDGPSAGITIATAITSALLKIPVRRDVAMTGEITLRGHVLPIGGLKEKLLAAVRGKISKVLVPIENKKDLKEISKKVLKGLDIELVEHMDEVLKNTLSVKDPEKLFKKTAESKPTGSVTKKAKTKASNRLSA